MKNPYVYKNIILDKKYTKFEHEISFKTESSIYTLLSFPSQLTISLSLIFLPF